MNTPLPLDLFYEIALHVPHTRDVLALALTNRSIRAALLASSLFKSRLSLQGWDVSAWQDHDNAQVSGDWKQWIRIDYGYNRTLQLFEEAATDDNLIQLRQNPNLGNTTLVEVPSAGISAEPQNASTDSSPLLNENAITVWLRKLSEVLPMFISHHSAGNTSRITDQKYHKALWAYAWAVVELCYVTSRPPLLFPHEPVPSGCGWFGRACFGLIALLVQSNINTVKSIVSDVSKTIYSPMYLQAFWAMESQSMAWFSTSQFLLSKDITLTPLRVKERYCASFVMQTRIYLQLISEGTGSGLSLRAPSLYSMDPASRYSRPFEINSDAMSPLPWLRNGLAGAPLAGLSSDAGRPWAGYYTYTGFGQFDPPMYFDLRSATPPRTEPHCVYFDGEGSDHVGDFSLQGSCHTPTGAVWASKTYRDPGPQWFWSGMLTPFGMVGIWGNEGGGFIDSGWWWVWPREWSPTRSAGAAREG